VSLQALAAVCGGAQPLHTNSYDEALALPSEQAAEIALRTQQVIGHETGVANATDPLGGSHLVESLTHDLMSESRALMARVEEQGGAVAAIEAGFYQEQIQESAYRHQRLVEAGDRVIVGVNRFTETSQPTVPILTIGAALEAAQVERLAKLRAARSAGDVERALNALRAGAQGTANLLPLMRTALEARSTVGEVCGVLREVFGAYRPPVTV
jgi:methylmalonyl-CoA mutase N-terminal domain/subunit